MHDDGWIEAYAERSVDVRIAVMPRMTTPAGKRLAEQYMELTLPRRYRALYWPSNRRAADMVRTITPADIAVRDWRMGMYQTLDAIGARKSEGGETWIV
jgi:hypothetical protein